MIDFKFDGNGEGIERACFSGTTSTLVADVAALVSIMFGCIKHHNDDAAKIFKAMMIQMMNDPDIKKQVFSDELAESIGLFKKKKKKVKEESESVDKLLEKLIKVLSEEDDDEDEDEDG